MKNDLLQHKDPFPKTVADASRIIAGWNENSVIKTTTKQLMQTMA